MTQELTERPTRTERTYTDQDVDAALRAYIWASGNRRKASALLADQGLEIPHQTIGTWATETRTHQLARLREELQPEIEAHMAEVHQGLAQAAAEIEAKSIIKLNEKLDQDAIEPKDLSAVLQRSAVATGIHSEKHLLYSGRPTQRVERGSASEVLRKLKARGMAVVDGKREEVEVEMTESVPIGSVSGSGGGAQRPDSAA